MKPRPVNLTSPAPCGAFLFPSSQPFNRAAQAPRRPAKAGLPSALPLSPFLPLPPRLGQTRPLAAPSALAVRPPLVIHARTLPPPRRFPCPVPPFAVLGLPYPFPLPSAPPGKARQPLAAGPMPATCRPVRRQPPPRSIPCRPPRRPPAAKVRLTKQR